MWKMTVFLQFRVCFFEPPISLFQFGLSCQNYLIKIESIFSPTACPEKRPSQQKQLEREVKQRKVVFWAAEALLFSFFHNSSNWLPLLLLSSSFLPFQSYSEKKPGFNCNNFHYRRVTGSRNLILAFSVLMFKIMWILILRFSHAEHDTVRIS